MTRLIEVSGVQELAQNAGIEHLKFFQADVDQLSALAMKVLIKQIQMQLGLKDGHVVTKQLINELRKAAALGLIPSCPAARHKLELPRLTMDEFRRLVDRFSVMERNLICFALDTKMNLLDASLVRHDQIKNLLKQNKHTWHDEVTEIVRQTPRHLRCQYVFWYIDEDGQPGPIVDMTTRFKSTTGISWSTFEHLVQNMVMIDRQQDAQEVEQLLGV